MLGVRRKGVGALAVAHHQRQVLDGHEVRKRKATSKRIRERVPGFYVQEFAPGPAFDGWVYATVGVWDAVHDDVGHGMELVAASPRQDDAIVELVTMAAHFHAGPPAQRLDLGHTVPIGRPWLDSSPCDYLLVSRPFLLEAVEYCAWSTGHAHHLWLLPITSAERELKVKRGLTALEAKLANVDLLDPARPSAA